MEKTIGKAYTIPYALNNYRKNGQTNDCKMMLSFVKFIFCIFVSPFFKHSFKPFVSFVTLPFKNFSFNPDSLIFSSNLCCTLFAVSFGFVIVFPILNGDAASTSSLTVLLPSPDKTYMPLLT